MKEMKITHKLVSKLHWSYGEGFMCSCGATEYESGYAWHMNTVFNPHLANWIKDNLWQRPKGERGKVKGWERIKSTSYGLKHQYEQDVDGAYVSNDEFQSHMALLGYKTIRSTDTDLNREYERLYIVEKKRGYYG